MDQLSIGKIKSKVVIELECHCENCAEAIRRMLLIQLEDTHTITIQFEPEAEVISR